MPEGTQETTALTQSNNEVDAAVQQQQDVLSDDPIKEGETDDTKVKDVLDDETPEQSGAPEVYGEFTVPDGFEFEGEHLEKFSGLAKELGLSQEAAQKMVDYQVSIETAKVQQVTQTINGWAEESKADPEIMRNKVLIKQVLGTAPESLYSKDGGFLKDSGLTNNREFLRWVISIGKGIGVQEQPLINGNATKTEPLSEEDKMIKASLKSAGLD